LTTKMLASTVQFSTNTHPHPPTTTTHHRPPPREPRTSVLRSERACHQKNQPTPQHRNAGLFSQDPTGCLTPPTDPTTTASTPPPGGSTTAMHRTDQRLRQRLHHRAPPPPHSRGTRGPAPNRAAP
jgi:hypothetical protein